MPAGIAKVPCGSLELIVFQGDFAALGLVVGTGDCRGWELVLDRLSAFVLIFLLKRLNLLNRGLLFRGKAGRDKPKEECNGIGNPEKGAHSADLSVHYISITFEYTEKLEKGRSRNTSLSTPFP